MGGQEALWQLTRLAKVGEPFLRLPSRWELGTQWLGPILELYCTGLGTATADHRLLQRTWVGELP